jgi:RNA polymerase sigma-70 factor (ECF subfamily)
MILRRYDEMPYEDIAEVLGTTVSAVKSLLFRARETLRLKLKDWL